MAKKKAEQSSQTDRQPIPGPVSPEAINTELGIMRYVEKETDHEQVLFLEKIKTEQVFDRRLDVWNVQTNKNQYWVIANPAALYSQAQFPSYDYALTFHVGLRVRTVSNQRMDEAEKIQDQLAVPWRKWEQAAVALDQSNEAEDFQAVGILCRECLLSIVKTIVRDEMVPVGQAPPKRVDMIHGSALIAESIAQGSGAEEIRSYLKIISKAAWQYVNWLAHAAGPTRFDGMMAVQATEYVLMAYGAALLRPKNENSDP